MYVQYRGTGYWWAGLANLGPSWYSTTTNGVMSATDKNQVSACLLARVNSLGKHVTIDLQGSHPNLAGPATLEPALSCIDHISGPEAVFWGDLFVYPPNAYMCRTEMARTYGYTRACGLNCTDDIITDLGWCNDLVPGQTYTRCVETGTGTARAYGSCRNLDNTLAANSSTITAWRDFCQSTTALTQSSLGGSASTLSPDYSFTGVTGGGSVNVTLRGGTGDAIWWLTRSASGGLPTSFTTSTSGYSAGYTSDFGLAGFTESNGASQWATSSNQYRLKIGWKSAAAGWTLSARATLPTPAGVTANPELRLNSSCYTPGEPMTLTVKEPFAATDWWYLLDDAGRNGTLGSAATDTKVTIPAPMNVDHHRLDWGNTNQTRGKSRSSRLRFEVASNCDNFMALPMGEDFSLNKKCFAPNETMTLTLTDPSSTSDWYVIPGDNFRKGTVDTNAVGGQKLIAGPAAKGTYSMLFGRSGDSWGNYLTSVVFEVDNDCPVVPTTLSKTGLSGAASSRMYYTLTIPANQSRTITTSGGTGDVALVVRKGGQPHTTTGNYDCYSNRGYTDESCTISGGTTGGTYFVMVLSSSAGSYSGVTLKTLE